MKLVLDELDPWQTHTYLNTSREFEKIFNTLEKPCDKSQFANKVAEFSKKYE